LLVDQSVVSPADNDAPREVQKYYDNDFAEELALLLHGRSVGVCGHSSVLYIQRLREQGLECELFDQNSNVATGSNDEFHIPEFAKELRLGKQYDGIICFGVGERLFGKDQDKFLDGLTKHSKEMIVLSCAIEEKSGDGFENCRSNSYVIYQLRKRGFWINARTTLLVRTHCSLDRLKPGLMVFSRSRVPRSFAERRAVKRILGADIERLKVSNRGNSSLAKAAVGKAIRLMSLVQERATKAANRLRVLSYDATRANQQFPCMDMSKRTRDPRFFPVCFTCGKHFRFVRLALLSLSRCAPPISQIYVFMDKGDPLSELELEQLRAESQYPVIVRLTEFPMSSWGPKVQLSELKAYREIAEQMSANDFLVKFDSDVLFLSSEIFQFVAKSNAGAVGTHVSKLHDSEEQEEYMQGGCYFIGAKELRAIVSIPVAITALAPTKWGEIPEDQFFSGLLRRCGVKPLYNDFLYFDPVFIASGTEDSQLDASLKAIPDTAGVLHFEGNQWDKVDRSNMRRIAARLFGPLAPVSNPYHPASTRQNTLTSGAERVLASRAE
jgi:hypothetical protein